MLLRTNRFLIYINELDNGIKNWILKFADDTKISSAVNNDKDRNQLQNDLNNLLSWAEEWQMLFNVSKCKVMHFGYRNCEYSYYNSRGIGVGKRFGNNNQQRSQSISAM